MKKLWFDNDTWSRKFEFDNNNYVVGETWNDNQYYEGHISITAKIDNYSHIWVVWGGHGDAIYPISCFRSIHPIDSPHFNYRRSDNWSAAIPIDSAPDSAYQKIHIGVDNTYLIILRHGNSDIRCFWSFNNGTTWHDRPISIEFYGNFQWFYDEKDVTDKLFMFATHSKGSYWDGPGNHFFWTTATDIIDGNGAYASTQTTYDTPLYDFPITVDEIISIDNLTESKGAQHYGIAFNATDDRIYISFGANATTRNFGVGLFDKKLGTNDNWIVTVVEHFDNGAILEDLEIFRNSLYLLAVFDVGLEKFKIRYANSSTPHDLGSWIWKNLSDKKYTSPEIEDTISYVFRNSDLIPLTDRILVFSVDYNRHLTCVSYGDARDQNGRTVDWVAIKYIIVGSDPDAPEAPKIDGPTNGKVGKNYKYNFISTDPNGDNIYFYVEWGDGTNTGWVGPYNSGKQVIFNHTWGSSGEYTIRAKAKDIHGKRSLWSDPLLVNIVLPVIEIGDITGGLFRISAIIKNIGLVEINNVSWCISLRGGLIILGGNTTGMIYSIPIKGEITIKSKFILGIGQTLITVRAEEPPVASDKKDQVARLLLFFIKI